MWSYLLNADKESQVRVVCTFPLYSSGLLWLNSFCQKNESIFLYELGLAATAIRKKRSFLLGFVHTVLFKTVDVEVLKVAKFTQILNHLSEDRYCLKDKGGIVTEAVFYSQSQGTAEEIVCCHLPSRPVDVTCHVLCNGTQWFEHERNLIYY